MLLCFFCGFLWLVGGVDWVEGGVVYGVFVLGGGKMLILLLLL